MTYPTGADLAAADLAAALRPTLPADLQPGAFVNPGAGQHGIDPKQLPSGPDGLPGPNDVRWHLAAALGLMAGDKVAETAVTPQTDQKPSPDLAGAPLTDQPEASKYGTQELTQTAQPKGVTTLNPPAPVQGVTGDGILQAANKYLGIKYVYGAPGTGANPDAFDCSSFVQRVFADKGIMLPRVTYDQVKMGIPITSQAALQAGDLIFMMGDGNRVNGHVGIYVGNGIMVNAPHTGAVVRYDNVPWGSVTGMRRVT